MVICHYIAKEFQSIKTFEDFGLLVMADSVGVDQVIARRGRELRQRFEIGLQQVVNERDALWMSCPNKDELIPGLPDHIVEDRIWPKLVDSIERVDRDVRLKDLIDTLVSVMLLSKKWSHVAKYSKLGAVAKLMQTLPPQTEFHIVEAYFKHYMIQVPPMDLLSTFPLGELQRRVNYWAATHLSEGNEMDDFLQLYSRYFNLTVSRSNLWKRNGEFGRIESDLVNSLRLLAE